ncbi:MAG: amidohydrolase family protein, partial [Alphaproteobacteria bacterium]
DKVMFGTDWPVVDPERAMSDVAGMDWKPDAKRKVMRNNALKLYGL